MEQQLHTKPTFKDTIGTSNELQPFMSPGHITYIQERLIALATERKGDPVRVLEWGSGGSTVYFTKFLKKSDYRYTWVSLEYKRSWYEIVHTAVSHDPCTELVLFPIGDRPSQGKNSDPMNDYVEYPASRNELFDLIIVDGRKRRRCLLEAQQILAPGGEVLLHDAWRPQYHCALRAYRDSQFLGVWLWRGSNSALSRYGALLRYVGNTYYRVFALLYRLYRLPLLFLRWVKHSLLKKLWVFVRRA